MRGIYNTMSIIKKTLKRGYSLLVKNSPVLASKIIYYRSLGKKLNLKNPVTFNEKLMWLKLYEDDSLKTRCADKYLVRNYIGQKGYSNLLIDLHEVYEHVEEIDFKKLPDRFVMKCTHGSGFNIICRNKDEMDEAKIKLQIKQWMNMDYSLVAAEPHYSNIKPRITVETYLERLDLSEPIDYKIHCFHGEPQFIEVMLEESASKKKEILFNCNWEVLPYNNDSLTLIDAIEKPEKLNEMLEIARDLSKVFTYVRVDFYYFNKNIYFGELTFTPAACLDKDFIDGTENLVGELLDLTAVKRKRSSMSGISKSVNMK